jgi:hypothetical protein
MININMISIIGQLYCMSHSWGVSVKFADKPCSERMAIVQSCQVQMIKNLEVVGAFSAKKFFPEKIIFDDLPHPTPPPGRQKNFGQYTILGVQKFFGRTKIFRDIIQIYCK